MATTDMVMTVTQLPGVSPNLATNGTFETNVTGWESNSAFGSYAVATFARSTVQFHGGAASLLATWPTTTGASWVNTNVTGLTVGVTYEFTKWVYVPAGSPNVRLAAVFTAFGGLTVTAKDSWTKTSMTMVATATNHLVGVETVGGATAGQLCYVDDVKFALPDTAYLMVAADGANTSSPCDTQPIQLPSELWTPNYAVNDRVQATIRTPQMPLVTGFAQ